MGWVQIAMEIGLAMVKAAPDAWAAFQDHHAAIKAVDPGRRRDIDAEIDAELAKGANGK